MGILWHQGESDSHRIEDVELYRDRFMNMITSVINDLCLPKNIPIIIGELVEFVGEYDGGKCKYYKEINIILRKLSDELLYGGFVSSKGLSCKNDGIHFNSKSYREFGKRYFEVYLKTVKK